MTTEEVDSEQVAAGRVIEAYIKLRDQRSEAKREFEENDALLKSKMATLSLWLSKQMMRIGSDNLSAHGVGTAYRELERKFTAADWPSYWQFIAETGRFDMIQKRVGEGAVDEYFKETGELPPGINLFQEYVVKVRRK